MPKSAHGNRLRIGRYSEPGRIYLITVVCRNREPAFAEFHRGRCAVRAMVLCQQSVATLCYVVMPDHVHWLMQLNDAENLSSVVQRFKSHTTRLLHRQRNPGEQIWMRGFHDRALRKEESIVDAARYVVANPLRAGLVKSLKQYSLWDAIWL